MTDTEIWPHVTIRMWIVGASAVWKRKIEDMAPNHICPSSPWSWPSGSGRFRCSSPTTSATGCGSRPRWSSDCEGARDHRRRAARHERAAAAAARPAEPEDPPPRRADREPPTPATAHPPPHHRHLPQSRQQMKKPGRSGLFKRGSLSLHEFPEVRDSRADAFFTADTSINPRSCNWPGVKSSLLIFSNGRRSR
jgi:hypothetical protein